MSTMTSMLLRMQNGDIRALARLISYIENETEGWKGILQSLKTKTSTPVIGITGPPGAGKSTLIDGLIAKILERNEKVAVLAIDPSSPFNFGALLGDRIRLSEHFTNPHVFIRSLASRGALGGISSKTLEITDLLRHAGFDYIFIETVGVGQTEVEIAGLAETTIVTLVPESGDEIQVMKAGLMEIADIFIVNKGDRPDAEKFVQNLNHLTHSLPVEKGVIPVIKTIASKREGLDEVLEAIRSRNQESGLSARQLHFIAHKVLLYIQTQRMADINPVELQEKVRKEMEINPEFNIYKFAESFS